MIQIVCFRPIFAVYQIINTYISKSRKIFNLISLKRLTPEYPKWTKSDRGSSHFRHGLDPRLRFMCLRFSLLIVFLQLKLLYAINESDKNFILK